MSDKQIPTTERLARALEDLNNPHLAGIIRSARAGRYDDFKSPLTFPQSALVNELLQYGQTAFVKRVLEGEFDATMEEADAWMQSPDGQSILSRLVNGL